MKFLITWSAVTREYIDGVYEYDGITHSEEVEAESEEEAMDKELELSQNLPAEFSNYSNITIEIEEIY